MSDSNTFNTMTLSDDDLEYNMITNELEEKWEREKDEFIKTYLKVSTPCNDMENANITEEEVNVSIGNIDKFAGGDDCYIPRTQSFTDKELKNYTRQHEQCKFKHPSDEYEWAQTQDKKCSKCKIIKKLSLFNGNCSGRDAFDKQGYRLRRPECGECTKSATRGKSHAIKKAKELGVQYVAPKGTLCGICNNPASIGNGIVFDHCHKTQTFRGYCCNSCNRSVGVLGDTAVGLFKAGFYVSGNNVDNFSKSLFDAIGEKNAEILIKNLTSMIENEKK